MHFIYHDGTVKDVETLDQMYMKMKKPQKQLVRIAFDPRKSQCSKFNFIHDQSAPPTCQLIRLKTDSLSVFNLDVIQVGIWMLFLIQMK